MEKYRRLPKRQTVRFINEKYYRLNKDVDSDSMTAEEKEQHSKNGGLHVDSKWYQEEEYQTVIENAWSKNNGLEKATDLHKKMLEGWKLLWMLTELGTVGMRMH